MASSSILPKAEIDNHSDQECLIDDKTDDHVTNDEENDDNDDVDPPTPVRLNIIFTDVVQQQQATVEWQERMIEFLFHQNTEPLSRRESTMKNDKSEMTRPT